MEERVNKEKWKEVRKVTTMERWNKKRIGGEEW